MACDPHTAAVTGISTGLRRCCLHAGIVKSTKMTRTIIVRRNYAHFIKKYSRSARHLFTWLQM